MENEQENATHENAEEVLDLDLEEETAESQPKKEYSTEQKLARVERMREKYLKELGLDKVDSKKSEKTEQKASKSDDNGLLQKAFLRTAGITDADEVEEALRTAKKWGVEVDQLVDDEDWKNKLDKIRTTKANTIATSNVKGGPNSSSAKNDSSYWISKGVPPTAADITDGATRRKIIREFVSASKNGGKKFYND
jgi:ribonuclease BN (tRNA processing enzyme)